MQQTARANIIGMRISLGLITDRDIRTQFPKAGRRSEVEMFEAMRGTFGSRLAHIAHAPCSWPLLIANRRNALRSFGRIGFMQKPLRTFRFDPQTESMKTNIATAAAKTDE